MKPLRTGVGAAAMVMAMAGPAAAQYGPTAPPPGPPPPGPTAPALPPPVTLSVETVAVGGSVTVSLPPGSCAAGAPLTVTLVRQGGASIILFSGAANANGGFSASIAIPASSASGVYFILVQCTRTAPPPPSTAAGAPANFLGGLAVTGGSSSSAAAASVRSGVREELSGSNALAPVSIATSGPGPVVAIPTNQPTAANSADARQATPSAVIPSEIVGIVRESMTPAQEAKAVKAVSEGDAKLVIAEDGVKLSTLGNPQAAATASTATTPSSSSSGPSGWLVGGMAALISGAGLVTLRSRKNARRSS